MKKKLLFFHFDLKGGGAEKVLVELVNGLDKSKYDITVQTLFGVGLYIKKLDKDIHFKCVFKNQFRGSSLFFRLFSPSFLYRLLVKDRYDVEIAYIETEPTRILGGSKKKDTKKIAWVHTTLQKKPKSYRSIKELTTCYQNFDRIVFLSKMAQEAFYTLTNRSDWPSAIVRNLIDSNRVIQMSKETVDLNDDGKTRIIHLGRLNRIKGAFRLLQILHNLKNKGLNQWHLYYLGIGEQQKDIELYIQNNNLQNDVTLLGFQTNTYKYLAKMDLFVCASLREGYSTAAVEATILGIPTLTTNCSGMKEIFENGQFGMIVENDDSAIEQGIEHFLKDPSLFEQYKSQLSKRRSYFDYDSILKENEDFIDSVINM